MLRVGVLPALLPRRRRHRLTSPPARDDRCGCVAHVNHIAKPASKRCCRWLLLPALGLLFRQLGGWWLLLLVFVFMCSGFLHHLLKQRVVGIFRGVGDAGEDGRIDDLD